MNKPKVLTDDMLTYLDGLRESGETNMFGAGQYIMNEFGLDHRDTKAVVLYWMKTYGERHAEEI
jgi:hypothetical protein